MIYMQKCLNCKHSERDPDWETLECKCEESDFNGDWVDENHCCHCWERGE